MINNPYRKAVNLGGAAIGLAALVATGIAANYAGHNQAQYLAGAPNHGLQDGTHRVDTVCYGAPFCPLRTLSIDVAGGQIVNVDVRYHDINRQSQSRNTRAVRALTQAAIKSQSADGLDLITGATVTSQMFKSSLQDAINLAHQ